MHIKSQNSCNKKKQLDEIRSYNPYIQGKDETNPGLNIETSVHLPDPPSILQLIGRATREAPDQPALVFEDKFLTYKELDTLSNQLANHLQSMGIREEDVVPICMDRSIEMVVAILGILKAGGAYAPIDPGYPQPRIQQILQETGASVVVTQHRMRSQLATLSNKIKLLEWEDTALVLRSQSELPPKANIHPETLAYVIFTSGSTGRPKGVLVEHGQLGHSASARNSYYGGLHHTLLIPSFTFDASLAAIFGSLCSGGCLIICSQQDLQDPQQLAQLIPQIDTLLCVPSYYQFLLEGGFLQDARVSKVILGGEAINPSLVSSHFEKNKKAQLYNEYGPTETTIWATVEHIESPESIISIGLPIEGAEIHILDHDGKPVGENTIGELCIGGKGLARGYLNDPENTATHFVENPLIASGSRLYKTGDLGYRLQDGRIVFVGRTDDQVKINGYRIEPGQIEAALHQISGVRKAAVIAKDAQQGGKYLVAFVQQDGTWDNVGLKAQLQQRLPDYMLPNLWVQMDNFPLTSNGKVDRRALQLHQYPDAPLITDLGATDPIEDFLLSLWRQYLPIPATIDDDFFEAGGNSLMAMNVVAAIRHAMKIDLSVSTFFKMPTVAKLAECIKPLVAETSQKAEDVPSEDANRKSVPLSYGQENFWLIEQMGESLAYHLPFAFRIQGDVDVLALTTAIRTILQRHEPLRTTIQGEGEDLYALSLPSEDWTLTQLEDAFEPDRLAELIQLSFDLQQDYMLRAWLIQHAPEDHSLLFVIHHIAFDAWSKTVFLEELWSAYHAFVSGSPLALPELSISYTNYAHSQKSNAHRAFGKLEYWKGKLQDFSPLKLPRDHFLDPTQTQGAIKRFAISSRLLGKIKALSRRQGATDFMTLLAGFKILLHRYSSQEDILVGTAIAGREQAGTEALVGYFVNSLPLRTKIKGTAAFLDVLNQVKQTTLEAYDAKEVPFEKIVAEMGLERLSGQNPFFQVMFNFHNVPQAAIDENNPLNLSMLDLPQVTSKFDLTFSLSEDGDQIKGEVEYRTGTYRSSTIDRMIQHYLLLLEMAVQQPEESIGRLNIIGEKEQLLLRALNQTSREYPKGETILDLLEHQVGKTPDKTAVVFGDQQISYNELDEKSNQLAHLLWEKGAREETLVLLCMNRSLEMVIAILGILKSGAAYVPVDPAYPQERKEFIQEDTAAQLTVTDPENQKSLSATLESDLIILEKGAANLQNHSTQKVETAIQPAHLAYIIYTSGSTGKPKGVMIEHGNVYAFMSWCKEEFSSSPVDIIYAATSVCFDLSVFEIFYSLTTGTSMRLLENALEVKQYLPEDSRVMINTVPSVVGHLLEEHTDLSNVSVLNMAGEPVTKTILDHLDVDRIQVRNLYGPTEDTTYSTFYRITAERKLWIGKPISNTCVYIINQQGSLNPVGVPGEICLSGSGLARGYFNHPDLTHEKFILNPFIPEQGARMYKTGDIGRWLPNGHIEYLGRKDDQVKIRGYRIELGEIERALQQHEKVRQAVVLAKADHKGNQQLVGYLVVDGPWDKTSIVSFLKKRLPAYMVPSLWLQLEALPLTPNGKIDKKKLPDPLEERQAETAFVGPRNETETRLAQIWRDLLGNEQVGIYEDFFASGGHSLMATRFIAAVRKEYAVDVRLQDFFANPTIAGLAEHVVLGSKSSSLPAIQPNSPRPDRVPLSSNQESLWFIDQFGGSTQYHIPLLLKLEGVVDPIALETALTHILQRHEVLRTVILNDNGVPHQLTKDLGKILIKRTDRDDLYHDSHALQQLIHQEIAEPFDLSVDPMIRASLFRTGGNTHFLILVIHHIAFDGWSTFILLDELAGLYEAYADGSTPELPPPPFQYADYALWQKKLLHGDLLKNKLRYWEEKLRHTTPLQLPLDYPRPALQSYVGSVEIFEIGNQLKEKLQRVGQEHSATLFMTMLTAFKVLLHHYSQQQDICVGTVSAGRQQKETEKVIGYFTQTLPIRSLIIPNTSFAELLEEVKRTTLDAFENQEVPFEKIVAAANVKRDLSKNPLFQVMFVLQNYPESTQYDLPGLTFVHQSFQQTTSKFDLSFITVEKPSGLQVSVEYKSALFKPTTIAQIISDYLSLLNQLVSDPWEMIGPHLLKNEPVQEKENLAPSDTAAMLNHSGNTVKEKPDQEAQEKLIARIWKDTLGIPSIDVNDNFFEIGGEFTTAIQVKRLLEKELGVKQPLSIFFEHPTIKMLAQAQKEKDNQKIPRKSLVSIKPVGNKPPLYIVHAWGSNFLPLYRIAKNMHPDQPVYGLLPKGLDGEEELLSSVETIASYFIAEVLGQNPNQAINLAGYSSGGIIAYEMAQQLKTMGKEVKHLVIFDTIAGHSNRREKWQTKSENNLRTSIAKRWSDLLHSGAFRKLGQKQWLQKLRRFQISLGLEKDPPLTLAMKSMQSIENSYREASNKYQLKPYDGSIDLIKAKSPTIRSLKGKYLGWDAYVTKVNLREIQAERENMFVAPYDLNFAQTLQNILED